MNYKMQAWKSYVSENKIDQDSNNEKSDNITPAMLHQSERNDADYNRFESSLTKNVNEEYKSNIKSNTMFVENKEFESSPNKNRGVEYLETCQDIDLDDKFLQITNPGVSDCSPEAVRSSQIYYKKIVKYLKEQERVYLEKSNYNSLSKMLAKIHRILEKINSAGVELVQVFNLPNRNKDFGFKMFFINLDIWGSQKNNQMPTRKESKDQVELARITLERCVALMKNEKGKIFEIVRYKTIFVLNCFEKISKYLNERTKIEQVSKPSQIIKLNENKINFHHIPASIQENNDNSDNDNLEDEDKFETIDLKNFKLRSSSISEENKEGTIRDPGDIENSQDLSPFSINEYSKINHSYFRTSSDPSPDVKGHLLLVRCGHNGNLNIEEKNILEKHLTNAGFISTLSTSNIN